MWGEFYMTQIRYKKKFNRRVDMRLLRETGVVKTTTVKRAIAKAFRIHWDKRQKKARFPFRKCYAFNIYRNEGKPKDDPVHMYVGKLGLKVVKDLKPDHSAY
jgi:hypothetical protein